jgi:hypothetical protein
MSLSGDQLVRCIEVMDKLFSRHISAMFAQPVDPLRDDCLDYFDVIKQPMDLGTIKAKLASNQYKSVAEWKSDVNLVWTNSVTYNSKSTLLRLITKDLSDLFQKQTASFSDSPQADWNDELQALGTEMGQVMKEITSSSALTKSDPSARQKVAKRVNSGKTIEGGKAFGREELLRLTNDINAISDVQKLCEITELVKDQESDFEDIGEDIDVDLTTLRLPTLVLLRKKVDELLTR